MSVVISNPSITHTFGNVACFAIDYVQSYFPENYFTKTHLSTKMAHRQLDVFRAKSGFWKNKKPLLVMRPRIELDDSSKWFYGSTMMAGVTHNTSPMEFGNLVPFIHDIEHGVGVRFLWNRFNIIFDVSIIVDTYNKQINIANDLKNRFLSEFMNIPRFHTLLEAYVPKSIVHPIADKFGIEHTDTSSILNYMNTYAKTPVTYKLKNASGNNEFFMMYPTNIEVMASDLSIDDGETKGIIADTYTINFSLSLGFNAVGAWYLFLGDGTEEVRRVPMDDLIDGDRIVPISSIPLGFIKLEPGWKVQASPFYFVTTEDPKVDTTSIADILSPSSMQSLILHHKKYNIPLDSFLKFRCFKGRQELPRGINGFDISLEDMCIYTYNPDPRETYRLFAIINTLAINNMASEITNFNKET